MEHKTAKIGLMTSTSLVVASMIGTGVFTSLGFQVVDIKTGFALILLWVIGGIDAFCGAVTYAELGSAFPRSGGEYSLLSRLTHPSFGFVAGWVSATVGFAAPASIAAMALSGYMQSIFPGLPGDHFAAGTILLLTLLHARSLKYGTWFQDASTLLKAVLIIGLILSAFWAENATNLTFNPQNSSWSEVFSGPFAVALVFVSYSYTGWNSSIYIVGEIDKPSSLPKSLFMGTALVMILYILLNFVFLYTVPIDQLEGQIEVGYLVGSAIFGKSGGLIMAGLISVLLLSTVSAYVFLGPRIIQVMGEDFKALSWFSRTSGNGIPVNAFLSSLVLSLLFIYTSTFEQVVVYTAFLLILITTITVGSIFILRTRFKHIKTAYRTWGYPITPILFLSINAWILGYLLQEKLLESLVAIGIFFIGLTLYLITSKASSR